MARDRLALDAQTGCCINLFLSRRERDKTDKSRQKDKRQVALSSPSPAPPSPATGVTVRPASHLFSHPPPAHAVADAVATTVAATISALRSSAVRQTVCVQSGVSGSHGKETTHRRRRRDFLRLPTKSLFTFDWRHRLIGWLLSLRPSPVFSSLRASPHLFSLVTSVVTGASQDCNHVLYFSSDLLRTLTPLHRGPRSTVGSATGS